MNGASVRVYSKAVDGGKKVSDHFRVREFACSDGSDPIFISPALVGVLENIRVHFGKPVHINSGFRTYAKNKATKNASPKSQHLYGMASDVRIDGVTPKQIADYAETLMPKSGGIGIYSTFCHVDVRAVKSRWNG